MQTAKMCLLVFGVSSWTHATVSVGQEEKGWTISTGGKVLPRV
jgi:hypothetical protein